MSGDLGNQVRGPGGDVRNGGGAGWDGTVYNNINTGNNRFTGGRRPTDAPTDASRNPADTERTIEQGIRELRQLRQAMAEDPQAAKDIAALTQQMQHLDPSRFPGNPEMVEAMHREIANSLDRLELTIERGGVSPQARSVKPHTIPAGYQDSVAEYYKRLSRKP